MNLTFQQDKPSLLDRVGTSRNVDAYVVGAVFLEGGVLAVTLGDGRIAFVKGDSAEDLHFVSVHDGPCLSLSEDLDGKHVLTGGDDGRLISTDVHGKTNLIAEDKGRWVEPVVVSKASALCAAGFGKTVRLFNREGAEVGAFEHSNTVGGLAFDPEGKRIAAAHYGGASLWWVKTSDQKPKLLPWAGSNLSLTWSPDGEYIVTATQENDLHGWRISDNADMRMSGYPVKVKSMSWLPKGRHLATSGAEPVVCWPFHGKGGPMGKAPVDLGGGFEGVVTVVAAHPKHDVVAAGYQDGTIILVQIERANSVLIKRPGEGAVTALAWSSDGQQLALGTEGGYIGRVTLSDWRAPA